LRGAPIMSIAKTATTLLTTPDDAARAARAEDKVVAARSPQPSTPEASALDASLDDPYYDVACTD
jgi:hypothetical protein